MAGWQYGGWSLGKRDGQWIARRRTDDGKWQRQRLGVAVRLGQRAGRSALVQFVNTVEGARSVAEPTLEMIFQSYATDRARDGINVVNFHGNWRHLADTFAPLTLSSITDEECRRYAEQRQSAGAARSTIWTELQRLRSAVNWHCKRERILPPSVWLPSKGPGRDRHISRDEALRLLDACEEPHLQLFVALAIGTGARTGAILDLTWDRVRFDTGEISYPLERVSTAITDRSRKKGRAVVAMPQNLQAMLAQAHAWRQCPSVVAYKGKPVKSVKKSFAGAVARAGLENVTPHTVRHSVATWLRDEGVSMQQISQLLGHSQVAVTEKVYAHPTAEGVRDAAERLNLRVVG